MAPSTMLLIEAPDAKLAPPQETWMMPSLSASANPRNAAFTVCEEVQLMAG